MTWWAWRQHRSQMLAAAGVLAALTVWMTVTGLSFAHEYRDLGIASCLAARGDCGQAIDQFEALHRGLALLVPLFLVAPGLIGVFWGAPLVAKEVEAGTHRLAWTQSVSRRRWLAWQLGFLGAGTVVLSALFAWLVSWWSGPLVGAGLDRFTPGIFDLRGIVPVFYAAFAFALGVAVGTVIRRTVAAMGVTLLGYAGVRAAVTFVARPHFATPLVVTSPMGQGNVRVDLADWVLHTEAVDALGHVVGRGGRINLKVMAGQCPPPNFVNPRGSIESCLQRIGVHMVSTIQPVSRYWSFQLIESVIFAAFTVLLVAFTVRWVRRRIV
ncbi:MAG: transporter [Actinobacteria bacterium]|nr:MAG: transporter [Actinomycetota bacterium]